MRVVIRQARCHHVERRMVVCGAEPRLEQPAFDDVEPPGRIGGGVVRRALAEIASLAKRNGRRHLSIRSRRSSPRSLRRLYRDCVSIALRIAPWITC